MLRTAAEPIRVAGGGDPAREADTELEKTEAVSLMNSLPGVSGLWDSDSALEAMVRAGDASGVSALGVCIMRSVLGARCVALGPGVGKGGKAAGFPVAEFTAADSDSGLSVLVARSSFLGVVVAAAAVSAIPTAFAAGFSGGAGADFGSGLEGILSINLSKSFSVFFLERRADLDAGVTGVTGVGAELFVDLGVSNAGKSSSSNAAVLCGSGFA